jgi:hypothetical protein
VATGTTANALALACMVQPYDSVFCSRVAHIEEDECAAPEFFSGGAKLTLVSEADGKIDAADLAERIAAGRDRGVHGAQPKALSLTQITERGTAYSLDEIAALTSLARDAGLATHLDGARFANACAALGLHTGRDDVEGRDRCGQFRRHEERLPGGGGRRDVRPRPRARTGATAQAGGAFVVEAPVSLGADAGLCHG